MAKETAKKEITSSQEDKVAPQTGVQKTLSTLFNKIAHAAEQVAVFAQRTAQVAGRIAAFAAAAAPVIGFIAAEVAIFDLTAVFAAAAPIAPVLIGGLAVAGVIGYEVGRRNKQNELKAAVAKARP